MRRVTNMSGSLWHISDESGAQADTWKPLEDDTYMNFTGTFAPFFSDLCLDYTAPSFFCFPTNFSSPLVLWSTQKNHLVPCAFWISRVKNLQGPWTIAKLWSSGLMLVENCCWRKVARGMYFKRKAFESALVEMLTEWTLNPATPLKQRSFSSKVLLKNSVECVFQGVISPSNYASRAPFTQGKVFKYNFPPHLFRPSFLPPPTIHSTFESFVGTNLKQPTKSPSLHHVTPTSIGQILTAKYPLGMSSTSTKMNTPKRKVSDSVKDPLSLSSKLAKLSYVLLLLAIQESMNRIQSYASLGNQQRQSRCWLAKTMSHSLRIIKLRANLD